MGGQHLALWHVLASTGMRRGEAPALRGTAWILRQQRLRTWAVAALV
jgi:hypothetical protein